MFSYTNSFRRLCLALNSMRLNVSAYCWFGAGNSNHFVLMHRSMHQDCRTHFSVHLPRLHHLLSCCLWPECMAYGHALAAIESHASTTASMELSAAIHTVECLWKTKRLSFSTSRASPNRFCTAKHHVNWGEENEKIHLASNLRQLPFFSYFVPFFKCSSIEHFEQTGFWQSSQIIFEGPSKPKPWPHNLQKKTRWIGKNIVLSKKIQLCVYWDKMLRCHRYYFAIFITILLREGRRQKNVSIDRKSYCVERKIK